MNRKQETIPSQQNLLKRFAAVKLYVIVSSYLTKKPVLETLEEVIQGGADAVQLREKTMSDPEFLTLSKEFRRITSQSRTLFIVNDRAEIAQKTDADGLHIGQSDISIHRARKIIGHSKILGVSTHTIAQARNAEREGANYIGVGPVFYTPTKDHEPPTGLGYIQEVKKEIMIPSVAIGAINLQNLKDVLKAGATRVAICSAIICSDNVIQATRSFKAQLS